MPSIVFSTGKEILAVHPTTRSVLWKLEADSVVASVFGIHKGRWKPLDVLGEEDIVLGQPGGGSGPEEGSPSTFLLLDSRPSSSSSPLEKDYHKLYDAPLMHWFEHYRSRQRLLRAASRGDLKALPSGNEKVEMTISVGGQQMSSSPRYCSPGRLDCSIWQATQLRLPSPSSASTPTDDYDYGMGVGNPASVNMLQPDGLLLSWRIVAILLALLAYAVVLGRIWYLHKKQSWLFAQGASTNQGGTLSSTSALSPPLYAHSQSLEVSALHLRSLPGDATALRRSMSLPDAHRHVRTLSRDNVGHPDRSSSRLSIYAKDDGMLPVQGIPPSVAPTSQVTITKGHASVLTSTSATSERPITTSGVVGPTTVAGTAIPLVQYSRYASEYEELGPLGKGGFGSVYQCKNVLDGREYAIKKVSIRSHKGDDDSRFEQRLERTLREVKILAVLDHPNIVRYFGAWLEIEKGDSGDDVDVDESTRGMSRCYSSTIVTESVSRWQPNPNRFRVGNRIEQDASEDSWSCSYPPTPFQPYHNRRIPLDDCGFIFEESEEDGQNSTTGGESRAVAQTALPLPDSSVVTPSRVSAQDRRPLAGPGAHDEVKPDTVPTAGASILSAVASPRRTARHTLYIQMQLCSQKTVGDFLANAAARQGSIPDGDGGIDIPLALRVFLQVAHAVGHVHDQGLIHRDLKPQNCFMDDSGVVKVGDFGLSRESADTKEDGFLINSSSMASLPAQSSAGEDHTAGVGTRAYASPEQMNGSDYDSSTDVSTSLIDWLSLSRVFRSLIPGHNVLRFARYIRWE
jgi:serine/threonine protein kinase